MKHVSIPRKPESAMPTAEKSLTPEYQTIPWRSTHGNPSSANQASEVQEKPQIHKPLPPLPLFTNPDRGQNRQVQFPKHQIPDPQALTNPYHRQTPEEHRAHHALTQGASQLPQSDQTAPKTPSSLETSPPDTTHPTSPDYRSQTPRQSGGLTSREQVILFRLLSTCRKRLHPALNPPIARDEERGRRGGNVACYRPLLAPSTRILLVAAEDVAALREVQALVAGLDARERRRLGARVKTRLTGAQGETRRYVLDLFVAEGEEEGTKLEIVGRRSGGRA